MSRRKAHAMTVTRSDSVGVEELQSLRRKLYEFVMDQADDLGEIMRGKKRVNMQQVAILRMALNKVLPDLAAKAVEVRKTGNHVTLSRDQLEELVRTRVTGNGIQIPQVPTPSREVIDAQVVEIPEGLEAGVEALSEKDREELSAFLRDLGESHDA